jgi:hypothetical protein
MQGFDFARSRGGRGPRATVACMKRIDRFIS